MTQTEAYFNSIDIGKFSDQALIEQYDFMKWSKASKIEQLKDRKKRHEKFDFANPSFDELLNKIETELKKRGKLWT